MFVETEDTPNPNAIKFFPNVGVSPNYPVYFNNIMEAYSKSSLAVKLFSLNNVEKVFFGSDFITVTKSAKGDWNIIKSDVLFTINNYFLSNDSVFDAPHQEEYKNINTPTEELSEIEEQIIEIIDTRIRPSVAADGGDVVYKGFENGIVKLALRGACSGCPSATITLKDGIESMLKYFIPEVESVEQVSED